MEKDNENLEQAIVDNGNAHDEIASKESPLLAGKFTSEKELENAYASLEAEFTKKSQELSEYKNGQKKEEVINEYITSLKSQKETPRVITSESGKFDFSKQGEKQTL
ncbi:MAG: hypothetical protein LBM01_01570, partial [Christensenellaceae bacterium]|nr:hypothetical protein [Christensenellaceae bacterium]